MMQTQPYDSLVDAIKSLMEAKKKRQYEQQFGQVSPILSREGDRATNIRDALAAIQAEQKPTGMGGVLDRLNPFAPARGGGSEIEQSLLAEQMQQPKQPAMKIVVGNGKTWLVNPTTGEKRDLGIVPPRSKVGERKISDIINDISKISGAAEKIPTEALGQPVIDEAIGRLRGPLMEQLGLEEIPGEKRKRFGIDWLAKDIPPQIRKRKRVESKIKMPAAAKEERHLVKKAKARPPKPKEYPNAVWNEEHQLWTIVRNGRLMGIQ